jgi:hypothetical protein
MAFKIRKAIGVLAIATLAGVALFGVGCGDGDDGSDRAVEWYVKRPVGPKRVRLYAVVEVCFGDVRLEQPITEYEGDRAYIEIRRTREESEGKQGGCLLGLQILHKTITLERDLDELVLFDASTDPPEQRWPPQQPWPPEE